MNTQKDDKWLDELISKSINTTKPEFDAEEWKKKHSEALQSILSRQTKPTLAGQLRVLKWIVSRPMTGLAAAAAVIIVVSGLLMIRNGHESNRSTPDLQLIAQSPAKIVSMMSLRTAYQKGGWDALEQRFQETLETFGPGPSSLSVQQLLEGLNGS